MSLKTPKKQVPISPEARAQEILKPARPEKKKGGLRIPQHRKSGKRGGRPPAIDQKVVSKLEAAFCNDFTPQEAWDYAGVKKATYYKWLSKSEEFSDRMRRAQQYALTLAKRAVIGQIKGDSDRKPDGNLGLRFLERRQPERYRPRLDPEDMPTPPITVILPGSKDHPRFTKTKKQ